jgi:PRTRC genetic system protein B
VLVLVLAEGTYIFCHKAGDAVTTKILTPSVVRAAFLDEPLDTGFLPPSVVRSGTTMQGAFCVAFYPPAPHTLRVTCDNKEATLTVPLPGMVFAGRGTSYWVWAVPGPTFSPDLQVYEPPLPNVYPQQHICWGSNSPPLASPATIDQAWQLFLASTFNGDLARHKSTSCPEDVRVLLRRLATKRAKTFPPGELVAYRQDYRIEQAIDARIFEKGW